MEWYRKPTGVFAVFLSETHSLTMFVGEKRAKKVTVAVSVQSSCPEMYSSSSCWISHTTRPLQETSKTYAILIDLIQLKQNTISLSVFLFYVFFPHRTWDAQMIDVQTKNNEIYCSDFNGGKRNNTGLQKFREQNKYRISVLYIKTESTE